MSIQIWTPSGLQSGRAYCIGPSADYRASSKSIPRESLRRDPPSWDATRICELVSWTRRDPLGHPVGLIPSLRGTPCGLYWSRRDPPGDPVGPIWSRRDPPEHPVRPIPIQKGPSGAPRGAYTGPEGSLRGTPWPERALLGTPWDLYQSSRDPPAYPMRPC